MPTCVVAPFYGNLKAWPLIIGIAVGFLLVGTMQQHKEDQKLFGTQWSYVAADGISQELAPAPDRVTASPFAKTYLIDGMQWAGFANLVVAITLSFLPWPERAPGILRVNTRNHDPGGRPLTHAQILDSVKHINEARKNPISIGCLVITFLAGNLSVPWYGPNYNGCNVETFAYRKADQLGDRVNGCFGDGSSNTGVDRCDGCTGYDTIFGLPTWVNGIIAATIIMICATTFVWSRVRGEEENEFYGRAWPTDLPLPAGEEEVHLGKLTTVPQDGKFFDSSRGLRASAVRVAPLDADVDLRRNKGAM